MTASASALSIGSWPQISRYAGKCVVRKTRFSPQTKYAPDITRKPRWPSAWASVSRIVVFAAAVITGSLSEAPAQTATGSIATARTAKKQHPDLPGVVFQHTLGRDRHDECTERADRRHHTKHLAAAPFRHRASASRQRQGRGRARQRDPDQHTRDDQSRLAAGGRHRREPGDINHGPRHQRNAQPEAVGDGANRRLRQSPDDILD